MAVDATRATTDVVEAMHRTIARAPWRPLVADERTRGVTGLVYRSIRAVAGWVGAGTEFAIERLQPVLDHVGAQVQGPARDALVAALNGVLGDHLAASGNPLALPMTFRRDGQELAQPDGARVVLLIHGLCMNDAQWHRHGHDHGAALARENGYAPAYLRYNSGLHVSTNGRELAQRLEAWLDAAPEPVSELAIVGYSLGGLVARSAFHHAEEAGRRWPARVRNLVFLGTPHQGAPLERGGNWIDMALGISRYSAPLAALGRLRSAGITDLRHASLLDEDWHEQDRFQRRARLPAMLPLPAGAACAALAASLSRAPGERLLGDGLVPVASALGRATDPSRTLAFAPQRQWIGYGMNHLDLLGNAQAWHALQRFLA